MSKYVLVHGQFYEIPDNSLMHWKYVKREKVGDKWKYYYSMDELREKAKGNLNANNAAKVATTSKVATAAKNTYAKATSAGKDVVNKLTGALKKDSSLIYDKRGTANDIAKKASETTSAKSGKVDLKKDSSLIYDKRGTASDIAKANAKTETKSETKKTVSTAEMHDAAKKVIRGEYGNGPDRVERLKKDGYDPDAIQNLVNDSISGKIKLGENVEKQDGRKEAVENTAKTTDVDLKKDSSLIYDKRGTAADIAKANAKAESSSSSSTSSKEIDLTKDSQLIYDKRGSSANVSEEAKTKAVNAVVNKVIRGDYGNGSKRVQELEKIGHDYVSVQDMVNEKLLKKNR